MDTADRLVGSRREFSSKSLIEIMGEQRERERNHLPESGVAVELNAKGHEEERSRREDGLAQSQSETRARPHRARHFIHPLLLLA